MSAHKYNPLRWVWQCLRRKYFGVKRDTLTSIVPVESEGARKKLETLLDGIGNDIRNNRHIPFSELGMTHFLSWSLLPGMRDESGREGAARLLFEANFEGSTDAFLNELYEKAGAVLKQEVYRRCGLPCESDVEGFRKFLLDHAVKAALPYEGYAGLSAREIQRDDLLCRRFHQSAATARSHRLAALAQQGVSEDFQQRGSEDTRWGLEARACFTAISRELQTGEARDGSPLRFASPLQTGEARDEPPLRFATRWELRRSRLMRWRPVRLVLSIPAAPALVAGALLLVHEVLSAAWEDWRRRRKGEPLPSAAPVPPAVTEAHQRKLDQIQDREDFQTQNHLTHYVELKPGLLRLPVLRLILWGWKHLAKYYFTDGNLAGIEGIHFARWVLIDGGRQWWPSPGRDGRARRLGLSRKRHGLLFLSNYDGSWEGYLDNFIDRASLGLTTIWCNTQGFPRPRIRWIPPDGRLPVSIQLGGDREEEFKHWVRQHQVRTLTWFSRHPDKTVANIRRNRDLRKRASGVPLSDTELRQWLRML